MSFCGKCEDPLPKDGSCVDCQGCHSSLHYGCTTIKSSTYAAMSKSRKENWRCELCRIVAQVVRVMPTQNASIDDSPILVDLKQTLGEIKLQLKECMDSQAFLSAQYDLVLKTQDDVLVKQAKLEKEVKEFINDGTNKDILIEDLKNKVNELDQASRSRDVIIHGVFEGRAESLSAIVKSIANKLDMNIQDGEIENVYRLKSRRNGVNGERGAPRAGSAPIAVTFASTQTRNKFLHNKRGVALKARDIVQEGVDGDIKIFEMMSPHFYRLFRDTCVKAREKQWKYVWFQGGKVRAKRNDTGVSLVIATSDDIGKLG